MLSFTLVSHIGYMIFGIALATAAGLRRRDLLRRAPHHHPDHAVPGRRAGRAARRHDVAGPARRAGRGARRVLGGAVLRAGDEPGRHPAAVRLPRQGRPARGRRRRRQRAGATCWSSAASVTSLLTLYAMARVWNRAFWRPAAQAPQEDTSAAAAAEAGPERARRSPVADGPATAAAPGRPRAGAPGGAGTPPWPRPPTRWTTGSTTSTSDRGPAAGAAAAAAGHGRRDGGDGGGHRGADRPGRSAVRHHRARVGRPARPDALPHGARRSGRP